MSRLHWAPARRRGWFIGRTDIGDYMHRWVIETPFGALRLHHILRSDEARGLHDHPWSFWTFLLTGGYTEVTRPAGGLERCQDCRRFSFRFVPAETAHRLILTRPVWTLVLTGPKVRDWGFIIDGVWTSWKVARAMWATNRPGAIYDKPWPVGDARDGGE